jgi:hypothetical protein
MAAIGGVSREREATRAFGGKEVFGISAQGAIDEADEAGVEVLVGRSRLG